MAAHIKSYAADTILMQMWQFVMQYTRIHASSNF
jgi:hypothetical protein